MFVFFFSSRRRNTRCALVTGVQTCALPIFIDAADLIVVGVRERPFDRIGVPLAALVEKRRRRRAKPVRRQIPRPIAHTAISRIHRILTERSLPRVKRRKDIILAANIRPKLRSEEHTSELQTLMRISYAVFCLKKKHKY